MEVTVPKSSGDFLQGTLDLLVLQVLRSGAEHGWGISQKIQAASRDVLEIQQGSLYPALRRLERRGLVTARQGTSANNRQARYYTLTALGQSFLTEEIANWQRFAGAVSLILAT